MVPVRWVINKALRRMTGGLSGEENLAGEEFR